MSSNSHKLNQIQGGEKKVMKKSLLLILSFAMVFTMFASVAFADTAATTDATATTTATATTYTPQQQFDILKAAGIFAGDPVLGANLDANMTRAQFAKIIALLWKLPQDSASASAYKDLAGSSWAAGYIGAASKAGLVNGVGQGKFNPSGDVTLEQLAKVFALAMNWDTTSTDVGTSIVSTWAKGYVAAAIKAGYITDGTDTTKGATRSSLVVATYTAVQAIAAETTPPPATMSPLAISSAVALNSKTVQVTLSTAAAAADLDASNIAVKDSSGAAVAVTSVAFAAYDSTNVTLLVKLGADTTVGSLYTVTSGTNSANFGGVSADTTAPTVSTVSSTDYNQVTITFSEPVDISGAVVTAAQLYTTATVPAGTALATSKIAYGSDSKTVVVTTDAQTASTLYSTSISGVKDLAGNVMTADTSHTFAGTAKPTAALTITSVTPVDSTHVNVKFAVKIDATTSLNPANYSIVSNNITPSVTIPVTAAVADSSDASTVDLTLGTDTAAATLYTLTVASGVTTMYGVPTTSALTFAFVGMAKDTTALPTPTATSTSNTTVTVTFGTKGADSVNAATTADMFSIVPTYFTTTPLAIKSISITDNVVTLTTASQSTGLYTLTIKSGIKDIAGNATTADTTVNFGGSAIASAISTASASLSGTTLTVTFNQNAGTNATDISHYSINNSVGYPTSAATVSGHANQVALTVPQTIDGKVYTLTVNGVANSDGVVTTTAMTATFVGAGLSATKASISGVVVLDNQTIEVYFDRSVTDPTINGANRIWNNNATIAGALTYSSDNGSTFANDLITTGYAYQDPNNANGLIVRKSASSFASVTSGTTFFLKGNTGLVANTATLAFAPNAAAATAPSVTAVQGLSTTYLRVFFSQGVYVDTTKNANFIVASAADSATPIGPTVTKITQVNATTYDLTLSSALTATNNQAYLNIQLAAGVKDATQKVALAVDTANANFTSTLFAASTMANVSNNITGITVVMSDARTMTVYYPEAMLADGTANAADNVANYALAKDNAGTATTGGTISSASYNSDTNSVTLYFSADVNNTNTGATTYYLGIKGNVSNLSGSNTVKNEITTGVVAPGGLVRQFAPNATAAAGPSISSATVSDDRYTLTETFSQNISSVNTVSGNLTAAQYAAAFTTNVTFEGDSSSTTVAAANINGTVAVSGNTVTVTFLRKLAAGSTGSIAFVSNASVKGSTATAADTTQTAVSFGVASSLFADTTAPTVISAAFTSATNLRIIFDGSVNAVAGDFTGGTTSAPGTFAISAISGSGTAVINLTIAGTPAIVTTNTGTVNIAATVKDTAGNALVAITNQAIAAF